jgi:uncharacterized membrane protein YeaQ/YmgE (transglycosylase-associated protein family)
MDPNSALFMFVVGGFIGTFLGFMISGEGYGWFFNAVSGSLGGVFGSQWIEATQADMGPIANAVVAACIASSVTAMILRT